MSCVFAIFISFCLSFKYLYIVFYTFFILILAILVHQIKLNENEIKKKINPLYLFFYISITINNKPVKAFHGVLNVSIFWNRSYAPSYYNRLKYKTMTHFRRFQQVWTRMSISRSISSTGQILIENTAHKNPEYTH